MADVIDMLSWLENKVNNLAQKYRCFKDTKACKNVEEDLKKAGVMLANRRTFYMYTKNRHDDNDKI